MKHKEHLKHLCDQTERKTLLSLPEDATWMLQCRHAGAISKWVGNCEVRDEDGSCTKRTLACLRKAKAKASQTGKTCDAKAKSKQRQVSRR